MDSPATSHLAPRSLCQLSQLATEWGFVDQDEPLAGLRANLVTALRTGQPTRDLWNAYIDAAEPQVEASDGDQVGAYARAALTLRRALICFEAGQNPEGVCQMELALQLAYRLSKAEEIQILIAVYQEVVTEAERAQGEAYFWEEAGDHADAIRLYQRAAVLYQAAIDQGGSDAELGLWEHRLAECNLGLLQLADPPNSGFRPAIVVTLLAAANHRALLPDELAQTKALIAEHHQKPWFAQIVELLGTCSPPPSTP